MTKAKLLWKDYLRTHAVLWWRRSVPHTLVHAWVPGAHHVPHPRHHHRTHTRLAPLHALHACWPWSPHHHSVHFHAGSIGHHAVRSSRHLLHLLHSHPLHHLHLLVLLHLHA